MITKISKKHLISLSFIICYLSFGVGVTSCVDNDDDVPQNYYVATKQTAADFLQSNESRLSNFIQLLKRTQYFSLLSTYGQFTVIAPNNDAFSSYLSSSGYGSIDQIPQNVCDTLVRMHIVKNGAYFTTDIGEGTLPRLNMLDAYIEYSLGKKTDDTESFNYYVNKISRMVEYDDSVTNGVVHIVNSLIQPTSDLLPDLIANDSTITLFAQALKMTGMADSLREDMDLNYKWGTDQKSLDSINEDNPKITVRCTSGSALYTPCTWPRYRYQKYTVFVEPDSVYHKKGIKDINDLIAHAKAVYDATYPADAGKYDDKPKDRRNPLNRFVSYHLMNRQCAENYFCGARALREGCWLTDLADAEEYYETMLQHTIMRFCDPASGLYINRKAKVGNKLVEVRGARVLPPSESGTANQKAKNGLYHYIDDIIEYSTDVRDNVLCRRIRVDATTLSPDFMNNNGRRYGGASDDKLTGFRSDCIKDWVVRGRKAFVGVHTDIGYWNSYMANAVCVSGLFDVTFKLPPVPKGTYEIRLGYTCGSERGVVQFYVNDEPCGIPVDLRVYGPDPSIGWEEDKKDDDDANLSVDKAMHNRGYMKGLGAYRSENAENPLRANNWNLRRVLTTMYLDDKTDYYLRCKQVLDNDESYWSFDFIELCPKEIYASPSGEDKY